MRDDFTATTKRKLAERAGYICSNVDCRRSQIGPSKEDPEKSVNLGIAAHICAAAPGKGAARYDESQTSEERSSINNAIFLCTSCASLIDKNEGIDYPVTLLKDWKEQHEKWIAERLNKGELDNTKLETVIWEGVNNPITTIEAVNEVIINNGLTYNDAKAIASDVFKANFIKLKDEAAQVAFKRVEKFNEKLIKSLLKNNPESLLKFNNPSIQDSLFLGQKEHAKYGDKQLGNVLIEILLNRINQDDRSLTQIALDEAINTAPKLTKEQLNILTIIFVLRHLAPEISHEYASVKKIKEFIKTLILPFIIDFDSNMFFFKNIQQFNCCILGAKKIDFLQLLYESFCGVYMSEISVFFLETFSDADFLDFNKYAELFSYSRKDKSFIKFNSINLNFLKRELNRLSVPSKDQIKYIRAYEKYIPDIFSYRSRKDYEISFRFHLEEVFPKYKLFEEIWYYHLTTFELTSVGMSLAVTNLNITTGTNYRLNDWL